MPNMTQVSIQWYIVGLNSILYQDLRIANVNMNVKIYLFIVFCEIYDFKRQDYEAGKTFYLLRATNITTCPNFYKKPLDFNVTFKGTGTRQLVTIEAENHVDFNMTKVSENAEFKSDVKFGFQCILLRQASIKIHRCLGYEYACENFQAWNISPVCSFVRMKNQLWSSIFESMKPSNWRRGCPLTKQGRYSFVNTSLDVNELLKFYSDAAKYYWALHIQLHDKNVVMHCIYGSFHIMPYTKKISTTDDE